MKKYMLWISLTVMLLVLLIPMTLAKDIDIDDIEIEVKWTIDFNGSRLNLTISSPEDNDHILNLTNINNNGSDDFKIDIVRDIECDPGSDLAKDLIISTYAIATTLNNSFNIPKEFKECLEGRAQIAAHNERYKDEIGQYQNKSSTFESLYNSEVSKKGDIQSRLDVCNRDVLETNTGRNNCTTELEKIKKKPMQYAMWSILITLIAINMYNKSKEPKPPEMFEFPER